MLRCARSLLSDHGDVFRLLHEGFEHFTKLINHLDAKGEALIPTKGSLHSRRGGEEGGGRERLLEGGLVDQRASIELESDPDQGGLRSGQRMHPLLRLPLSLRLKSPHTRRQSSESGRYSSTAQQRETSSGEGMGGCDGER